MPRRSIQSAMSGASAPQDAPPDHDARQVDRSAAFPRVNGTDIPVLHDDSERDERTCVRPDLGASGVIPAPRRIYTATPPGAVASPPPPVIPKVVGPLRVSSRRQFAPVGVPVGVPVARPDVSGKVRAMQLVADPPPRRSWVLRLMVSVTLGVLVGGVVIAFFAHGGDQSAREMIESAIDWVRAPREMLAEQAAKESVALQAPSALAASGSASGSASAPASGEASGTSALAAAPATTLPQLPPATTATASAATASASAATAATASASGAAEGATGSHLPSNIKPVAVAPVKSAPAMPAAAPKGEAAKPEAAAAKKSAVKAERKSEKVVVKAEKSEKAPPPERAEKPQKSSASDDKSNSGNSGNKRSSSSGGGSDDGPVTAKERALAEAAKKLADRQIQQSLSP